MDFFAVLSSHMHIRRYYRLYTCISTRYNALLCSVTGMDVSRGKVLFCIIVRHCVKLWAVLQRPERVLRQDLRGGRGGTLEQEVAPELSFGECNDIPDRGALAEDCHQTVEACQCVSHTPGGDVRDRRTEREAPMWCCAEAQCLEEVVEGSLLFLVELVLWSMMVTVRPMTPDGQKLTCKI